MTGPEQGTGQGAWAKRDPARRSHEHFLVRALDPRLAAVLSAAGVGLWEWDFAEDTVHWDDLMARMHGLAPGSAPTLAEFEALVHPDDRELGLRMHRHGIEDGWFGYCYRCVRPDGSTAWIESGGRVFADGEGRPRWFVGVCKDVTGEIERADTYRAIFENSVDAMLLADDDYRYVDANPAAARLLGRDVEELVGRTGYEFSGLRDRAAAAWKELLDTGTLRGEGSLIAGDGNERLIDYRATAHIVPGRHLTVLRDITEQKQLETALRQSQKMEAVGRLAGGIAHDFNNLLTAISGYATMAFERAGAESDPRLRENIAQIQYAVDRAASLTRQLLAFSRRQVLRPQVIDVAEAVDAAVSLISHLTGEHVELRVSVAPEIGTIEADVSAIEQCLLNLALNARDAMPDGGRLTIDVQNVDVGEEWVEVRPEAVSGAYVCIAVGDTGVGVDDAIRGQIFDPFFTTKQPGEGTGLGLSTVYGIVRESGGFVVLNSEVGLGSLFKLYFPRSGQAAMRSEPGSPPEVGAGELVLVVDDEPVVRELLTQMLVRCGYRALSAGDAESAIAVCDANPDVAVVLTDIVMPNVNGVTLVRTLAERGHRVGVVYASGYPHHTAVAPDAVDADVPFLQKPFTREQLVAGVQEALRRRHAAH